ncbi:ribonuclease III [Acidipila sp. EB88]|uniref:ribonuclease III n=1 Tax=Acidipila sp. EB88 TaxID=2305226 RepID=UPI000F6028D4|nr:ribonuclease III [Acidipila sp. EB88]RRA48595.1 ribonuclease III [Acidipila sp. EB88]
MNRLEAQLGYAFTQGALLEQALTHSSLRHELQTNGPAAPRAGAGTAPTDNERLEFLGDAIVGMLVAEILFKRFPSLREGELTRMRAALVSRKHLGEVGETLQLGQWLRMGRSEERNGGRTKAVLLANCVEAITAALYLDSGELPVAAGFVERHIVGPLADTLFQKLKSNHAIGDYKSALQEFLQARGSGQPEYQLHAETGPDHRKRFLVEVRTAPSDPDGGRALAQGSGSTKKKAEQEAARRAFRKLGGEPAPNASEESEAERTDDENPARAVRLEASGGPV